MANAKKLWEKGQTKQKTTPAASSGPAASAVDNIVKNTQSAAAGQQRVSQSAVDQMLADVQKSRYATVSEVIRAGQKPVTAQPVQQNKITAGRESTTPLQKQTGSASIKDRLSKMAQVSRIGKDSTANKPLPTMTAGGALTGITSTAKPAVTDTVRKLNSLAADIRSNENDLINMNRRLSVLKAKANKGDASAVDSYNQLADRYNQKFDTYVANIGIYNTLYQGEYRDSAVRQNYAQRDYQEFRRQNRDAGVRQAYQQRRLEKELSAPRQIDIGKEGTRTIEHTPTRAEQAVGGALSYYGSGFAQAGGLIAKDLFREDGGQGHSATENVFNVGKSTEVAAAARAWDKVKAGGRDWADGLMKAGHELDERGEIQVKLAKQGLGTVGQALVDLGVVAIQMAGDIGLAVATGGSMLVPMGLRSYGNGYLTAEQMGYSGGEAELYGLGVAAVEVLSEKMFSVFSIAERYAKGVVKQEMSERVINAVVTRMAKSTTGRTALNRLMTLLFSAGSEGLEEVMAGIMEPVIRKATLDHSINVKQEIDWENALYEGLIGGILGGLGGSVDLRNTRATYWKYYKQGINENIERFEEAARKYGIESKEAQQAAKAVWDGGNRKMNTLAGLIVGANENGEGGTYVPIHKATTEDLEKGLPVTYHQRAAAEEAMRYGRTDAEGNPVQGPSIADSLYLGKYLKNEEKIRRQEAARREEAARLEAEEKARVDAEKTAQSARDVGTSAQGELTETSRGITPNEDGTVRLDTARSAQTRAQAPQGVADLNGIPESELTQEEKDELAYGSGAVEDLGQYTGLAQRMGAPVAGRSSARVESLPAANVARTDNANEITRRVEAMFDRLMGKGVLKGWRRVDEINKTGAEGRADIDNMEIELLASITGLSKEAAAAAHEAAHLARKVDPTLPRDILAIMRRRGVDTERLIAERMLLYKNRFEQMGRKWDPDKYNREYFEDEVCAKFIGDICKADSRYLDEIAAEDPGLIRRIINALRQALYRLTGDQRAECEQAIQRMNAALAKAGQNETVYNGGERFTFGGENAINADLDALGRAADMDAAGTEMRDIFRETGWFKGADGKWRFEIDDSKMKYRHQGDLNYMKDPEYREYVGLWDKVVASFDVPEEEELERFYELDRRYKNVVPQAVYRVTEGGAVLSDIIEHEELFENYPQLRNAPIRFDKLPQGDKGNYNPITNELTLNRSLRDAPEDTLVHEIQHALQSIEGFSEGASPEYWKRNAPAGEERSAYQLYRNTAGEIEARDVTARRKMSEEQRRNTMPDTGNENTVFAERGSGDARELTPEADLQATIRQLTEQVARLTDRLDGRETQAAAPETEAVAGNAETETSIPAEGMETLENANVTFDEETQSVAPADDRFNLQTWNESEYVQDRTEAAKTLAKGMGISQAKARKYIDDINSVAKMIADDKARLDFDAAEGLSPFVSNAEYGGSFDFSTLCKKRRLFTGTFTAIQNKLKNTALTPLDVLTLRKMMKDAGLEVPCGLCYVEGSRAGMGKFSQEFIRLYEKYNPDAEWVPTMKDVNTPDGVEAMRTEHPDVYKEYERFWNNHGKLRPGDPNLFASQQKPKLYMARSAYNGEVLKNFSKGDKVIDKNENGGLRIQSFSDFEIANMLDMMQVLMDMSRVGLAGQAYTKVPEFARAFGATGLKINLSLIAKGVDADGKLIFDDVEGMPFATAMEIRSQYSKNVGTILVVFDDAQLKAAMADERIDFIIPFHRSQWKKEQYEALGLPATTKDYTDQQGEKYLKPRYHEYQGRMVETKIKPIMSKTYWDYSKTGKENAEEYLRLCKEDGRRPVFYKLLVDNGDGSWSLQPDGSTDGYWKTLIDFKMYDNEGNGAPQLPVRPDFSMDEITRIMDEYEGGHGEFPVAEEIVDQFVEEYESEHGDERFSFAEEDTVAQKISRSDIDVLRRIGRKSVNSFSSDDISNSSKWASLYWRDLKEGSPFFRAWFGDWRAYDKSPVTVSDIPQFTSIKEVARSQRGASKNRDTGWDIVISDNGQHSTIAHAGAEHRSIYGLAGIKDLVSNAVLLDSETHEPHGKHPENDAIAFDHKLYALGRNYLGEIGLYRITVEDMFQDTKHPSDKRFHNLKYIEKVADVPMDALTGKTRSDGSTMGSPTTNYSVADIYRLVKTYDHEFTPAPKVDKAMLEDDGTPKKVYHQTAEEFWTFDNSNPAAGKYDSETPNGFFFKDNDHDIGIGGDRQMECYLRMLNPLHFADRKEANAWYCQHVDGYAARQKEMEAALKPFEDRLSAIEKQMFAADTTDEKYNQLDEEWNGVLEEMREAENEHRGELRSLLDDYFLGSGSEYDGIILDYDGHRYVDGKREDVKTYIVFEKGQAKSATDNIGTFDRSNPDVRYSFTEEEGAEAEAPKDLESMEPSERAKELIAAAAHAKQVQKQTQKILRSLRLGEKEHKLVDSLLSGALTVDELPGDVNRRGIERAYEARKAAREAQAPVDEYNKQRRAALDKTAEALAENSDEWKDRKSRFGYDRETARRNIQHMVKDEAEANALIRTYIDPIREHEAEKNRMVSRYNERIKRLGIETRKRRGNKVSEAYAIQYVGELEFIRDWLEQLPEGETRGDVTYQEAMTMLSEFWAENPNLDRARIQAAVAEFRSIYDEIFAMINEARVLNGYAPIDYRKGYFPHFTSNSADSIIQSLANGLGLGVEVTELPTSIAGTTHLFRPGIQWSGHMLARTGNDTDYNVLEGWDRYIPAVANIIYHTEDIQNLRALERTLRSKYSDTTLRDEIERTRTDRNLTETQRSTILDGLFKRDVTQLNYFVQWLREYTNQLAGKRADLDRVAEAEAGRKLYRLVQKFENRVAANMLGGNISSAMTNFVPLFQAWGNVRTASMIRAVWDTTVGAIKHDGFRDGSDFLVNRRGYNAMYQTLFDKTKNGLFLPFNVIDDFVSETIVRARYYDELRSGLGPEAALMAADTFAGSVLADRAVGELPVIFNSKNPFVKVFTMFQVEANNDLSHFFKDVPKDTKKKGVAAVFLAILKYVIGVHIFNDLFEALFGRRVSFDPLEMLNNLVGDVTGYELPNGFELSAELIRTGQWPGWEAFESDRGDDFFGDLLGKDGDLASWLEQLPFLGTLVGGGRYPIFSPLPEQEQFNAGLQAFADLIKKEDEQERDNAYDLQKMYKAARAPLAYFLPPAFGGQARKIAEGLYAWRQGGSYTITTEGDKRLQYPIEGAADLIRAMTFGKTATRAGKKWVRSDFDTLSIEQTAAYIDLVTAGSDSQKIYDILHDLKGEERDSIAKAYALASADLKDSERVRLLDALVSESQSEKFAAMMTEGGLTFRQCAEVYDKYHELSKMGELKDSDDSYVYKKAYLATQFAAWIDGEGYTDEQKEVIEGQYKFWNMVPAEAGNYERFTAAGLSIDKALDLTDDWSELKALPGSTYVSTVQKIGAVAAAGYLTEKERQNVVRSLMDDEKNADGVSQQTKFDQYIVGYQVPIECYSQYLTQSNGLKGDDLNGDGKTDSGSLVKKKLAVIDRLPLQPGQKTALALFATGNAESTIRKYAPWL